MIDILLIILMIDLLFIMLMVDYCLFCLHLDREEKSILFNQTKVKCT